MENKKLQNGIEEIKKIKMASVEKKRILENVLLFSIPKKKPSYSPWMTYSFISILNKRSLVYFVIIPLVFILSGGGVVFASQDSLPDSILYPIKINFIEPIKESLTFSPEAKARYESSLATKRLVEAETLATLGKLNKSNENKINDLLEKHTIALNKALDKTRETKANGQVDEIITNFQAGMNAHAKVLDYLTKREGVSNADNHNNISNINNIDNKTNTDDTDNNIISNKARMKARDILHNSNNNSDLNKIDNKSDKYDKRKDSIQYLINKTNADLNSIEIDNSPVKQKIINDVKKILKDTENLLNEADIKEKDGDRAGAYHSLLDSESSIKEASILFKTGIWINTIHNNEGRGEHYKK